MSKEYRYRTRGTCSSEIRFEIDDENKVRNVRFTGGCNGNLQAVGRLVDGMTPEQIAERCGGIRCGYKSTSCPDQLSKAVTEAIAAEAQEKNKSL